MVVFHISIPFEMNPNKTKLVCLKEFKFNKDVVQNL